MANGTWWSQIGNESGWTNYSRCVIKEIIDNDNVVGLVQVSGILFLTILLLDNTQYPELQLLPPLSAILIDCLVFHAAFNTMSAYHGVSWVSYQYYWSIYPDTSQSVVILTP